MNLYFPVVGEMWIAGEGDVAETPPSFLFLTL